MKFLSDVMSFVSALGCSGSLSDRSEGTGLTGPSACWLVWTGLTGPRDRSDQPVAAALLLRFACVRDMTYCITDLFMLFTQTCCTPQMLRFRGSLICAQYVYFGL